MRCCCCLCRNSSASLSLCSKVAIAAAIAASTSALCDATLFSSSSFVSFSFLSLCLRLDLITLGLDNPCHLSYLCALLHLVQSTFLLQWLVRRSLVDVACRGSCFLLYSLHEFERHLLAFFLEWCFPFNAPFLQGGPFCLPWRHFWMAVGREDFFSLLFPPPDPLPRAVIITAFATVASGVSAIAARGTRSRLL